MIINNKIMPNAQSKSEINQMVWMWTFCSFSPLIYFAISWILRNSFHMSSGLLDLSADTSNNLFLISLSVMPLAQILILYTHKKYKSLFLTATDENHLLNLLKKRNLILLLCSELSGLTGFILFFLTGNLRDVFLLGFYSMLCYAQCHPTRKQPFKMS